MNAPLDPELNQAIVALVEDLLPQGFDVSPDAPETFEELVANYAKTGRLVVSSLHSDRTIYGSPSVNYAFRAWHDWVHVACNCPLTLEGERDAALIQIDQIALYADNQAQAERWARIIFAEVDGQAQYFAQTGDFPTDQVAFVSAYLAT